MYNSIIPVDKILYDNKVDYLKEGLTPTCKLRAGTPIVLPLTWNNENVQKSNDAKAEGETATATTTSSKTETFADSIAEAGTEAEAAGAGVEAAGVEAATKAASVDADTEAEANVYSNKEDEQSIDEFVF
jgi:hypothetical protein